VYVIPWRGPYSGSTETGTTKRKKKADGDRDDEESLFGEGSEEKIDTGDAEDIQIVKRTLPRGETVVFRSSFLIIYNFQLRWYTVYP